MNKDILNNISVLYVEDETDVREFTGKLLESLVKNIYLAENGEEGLKLFKEKSNEINLIVSDINMPKMGGLEMCEEIKKIKKEIPIVITSAHNDPSFLKKAIEIGVSSYAMKPIDLYQLIDSMIKAIEPIILKQRLEELNISMETKVQQEVNKINTILDGQDNIVLVSNNNKINRVNKKFLEFFNVDSVEGFLDKYENIYSLFENGYGFITNEKLLSEDCWISYVKDLPEVDRVVKIKTNDDENKIFTINIDNYDNTEDHYVISLTDITKLKEKSNLLEYQASHDSLTGLFNRNKFNHIFGKELRRALRYKNDLSIVLFDIDHFKKVNDTHGHQVGDEVLKIISEIAIESVREHDVVVRWGGEEFLVLLPETNSVGANIVAEKMRTSIKAEAISSSNINITASFGVAILEENDDEKSFINRADEALYEAKNKGRDLVITA
jgi:diguanylate cyclase (GGDEF)-like protein